MESSQQDANVKWSNMQAYGFALASLAVGLTVGYLLHGPAKPPQGNAPQPERFSEMTLQMPTTDQMKHMADKQAEPLLQKLNQAPDDPALLSDIAKIYFTAHQFPEAISYAERSVKANPKRVGSRADLASYLFYSGDSKKAIATLEEALRVEPNDPQVLFNLGLLRLQAKDDRAGAVALWKQLLRTNPQLSRERQIAVRRAIASASTSDSAKLAR